ncbi:HDOD domain-containing protein [Pseudomonas sp. SJZ079]|uniref:HDOD domain-containing protein n=1 Tax=Pseudomonas sp. SJZ079 TaxID=2572887 RepID=UPI0011996258|nr:HDOD domain-containing protein [Pseudomonas sp. SJZ079]TWC41333.1 HDOD domain-containing protein [Pseudomonas sp. SJZ079]
MPKHSPLPRSLDAWLNQLGNQLLPVPAENLLLVRRAVSDSRRSLRDITELMQSSPALALSVLREANRKSNGLNQSSVSLESALGRLGLQRIEELLNRQPSMPASEIPQALRQIQLISQHAAQQANGLFAGRLARLWQEIHWGSLLFLAPIWALLTAHPELFELWEQRVLVKGEPATKVEHDVLGVPLLKLCLALAEHWRLPEWIIQGYRLLLNDRHLLAQALHIARRHPQPLHQQQFLDADNSLRRWLTQPANSILLANLLALSAHNVWSTPHSLRWQRLTGLYLQLPLDALQQQVHQFAAQSARQHPDRDLWHPAEALLWPWDARHLQAPSTPPAKAPQVSEWRQHCMQLLAQPSVFNNVAALTACASQALQACGMQRVLLLLADRTHSRLLAQQQIGLDQSAAGLKLDPQHSQVLRRLLSEPGQLRLTPGNIAQFSALLPGALKALFPSEHLLIRSLASHGRVMMIALADQTGAPINETSLHAFGKTVQCIERALSSFAKRGH